MNLNEHFDLINQALKIMNRPSDTESCPFNTPTALVTKCLEVESKLNELLGMLKGLGNIKPVGSFSEALQRIQNGEKVSRKAWNKDEFVFMLAGATVPYSTLVDPMIKKVCEGRTFIEAKPTIRKMKDNAVTTGWLPSMEDLFATDWVKL